MELYNPGTVETPVQFWLDAHTQIYTMEKKKKEKVPGSGRKSDSVVAKSFSEADYVKWTKIAIDLSIKGTSDWNIKNALAEQGLSIMQSREVRKRADEYVMKNYNKNIQTSLERAISQWQEILNMAMQQGNLKNVIKARENIDKLSGLNVQRIQTIDANYVPQVIELNENEREDGKDGDKDAAELY